MPASSRSTPALHATAPRRAPRLHAIALALAAMGSAGLASAQVLPATTLPTAPTTIRGTANVTFTNNSATVNQATERAVINWGSFNIGSAARVDHTGAGMSARAITLHRVVGLDGNPGTSRIEGTLASIGRVFIVNPSGVIFGSTAVVNVGALVASSRDVTDASLDQFSKGGTALAFEIGTNILDGTLGDTVQVEAGAKLEVQPNGSIVLIGGRDLRVGRDAVLSAPQGNITLVTAPTTAVDLTDSGFVKLQSAFDSDSQVVPRTMLIQGQLSAPGGTVQLRMEGRPQFPDNIRSNTGNITLDGAQLVAASTSTGAGRVEIAAVDGNIVLTNSNADVSASGADSGAGGSIVITGDNIRTLQVQAGPDQQQQVLNTRLGIAAAEPGASVTLRADGPAGGGLIRIGSVPDAQALGVPTTEPHAISIDPSTFISASATDKGNGGDIRISSSFNQLVAGDSGTARRQFAVVDMFATVRATGGPNGGDGGQVLVRGPALTFGGEGRLDFGGSSVDASAPLGAPGTLVLEAFNNVDLQFSAFSQPLVNPNVDSQPTTLGATLRTNDVADVLARNTHVTIHSTAVASDGNDSVPGAAQGGDITLLGNNAFTRSDGSTRVTLTLAADSDLTLQQGSRITSNAGPLNVHLRANADDAEEGRVMLLGSDDGISGQAAPVQIATLGGDLFLGGSTDNTAAQSFESPGVQLVSTHISTSGFSSAPSGNVTILGNSSDQGISIVNSTFSVGNMTAVGQGGLRGGLSISGSSIETTGGSIDLRGLGTAAPQTQLSIGAAFINSTIDIGNGGSVLLAGRFTGGNVVRQGPSAGVQVDGLTITGTAGSNRITIAGESSVVDGTGILDAAVQDSDVIGIGLGRGLHINAGGADVVLGGRGGSGGFDGFAFSIEGLSIDTQGRVNLRPLNVQPDAAVSVAESPDTPITVGNSDGQAGFVINNNWLNSSVSTDIFTPALVHAGAGIVIGSGSQTGNIRVVAGGLDQSDATSITLQNQGTRLNENEQLGPSEGINLDGDVLLPSTQLNLLSSGSITQAAETRLVTSQLVVQGSDQSEITLQQTGNRIAAISFDPPGSLAVSTSGNLSINGATAVGFSSDDTFTSTNITANQAGQSLSLQSTDGNIVLNQTIFSTGSVDLIAAGTFQAIGPATILSGEGATGWRIWAGNQQGFRGGALTGTAPAVFDCAFSGGACASGKALPEGNAFLFAQETPAVVIPDFNSPLLAQDFRGKAFFDDQRSEVYGSNTPSRPQVCAAVSTTRSSGEQDPKLDPLSMEWTRVRSQPQLSSCLEVRNDNACASF